MPYTPVTGLPGIGTTTTAQPREIFAGNIQFAQYAPGLHIIDGNSRDPSNANSDVLRAGTIMGRVTATGKWIPAVLGGTSAALGGAQTTLTVSPAAATELVRRNGGSTGTLKLTGPNAPGGTSRTFTVTYSAVNTATGVITITPTATGAVSAANAVFAMPVVDSTGSGTFTVTVEGITTGPITYNSTVATLITNTNAALDAAFGTSSLVSSGASLAAFKITASGTGYSGRPVGTPTSTLLAGSTGYTINGVGTVGAVTPATVTTPGVTAAAADQGEFIAGSLVGTVDGSATGVCLLGNRWGVKVTDQGGDSTDVLEDQLIIAGHIKASNIIGYPSDVGAQNALKAMLRTKCPALTFDDDFV